MKKILLTLVFVLFSIGVNSQVLIALLLGDKLNSGKIQFGLEGGYSLSTITGLESTRAERNWNLGFYFLIRMKEHWYVNTGVLVKSTLGNDQLTENDVLFLGLEEEQYNPDGTYSQRSGYFLVPVLAQYQFKNHIYVEGGAQFGLLTKGWVEYNYKDGDYSGTIKKTNTDNMNRLDAGLVAGTGFRLLKGLGWTLGAKYYYGLVNVYKGTTGNRNSTVFLKMNVPIGLSDEQKGEIKKAKAAKQEKKEATEKYQLKQEKKRQNQIEKDERKAEKERNKNEKN